MWATASLMLGAVILIACGQKEDSGVPPDSRPTTETAPPMETGDSTEPQDTAPIVDDDGDGWSPDEGDCDDADPERYPGAMELCNGIDDDCDDTEDESACPSGCDTWVPYDHSTIQGAVDAATDGAIVCVEVGEYGESVRIEDRSLTLLGAQGSEHTVLDAHQGGAVLTITGSASHEVVLQGLSLQGGWADYGGGLALEGATVEMDDLSIHDNEATVYGGGIAIAGGAAVRATGVWITGNQAGAKGAGLYATDAATLLLDDVHVDGNSADWSCGVGAFMGGGTWADVIASTFDGNQGSAAYCAFGGGGLGIHESTVTLTDTSLSGNALLAFGGGLGIADSDVELLQVELVGNQAGLDLYVRGRGGGLFAEGGGSLSMQSVTLSENDALWGDGGGAYLVDATVLTAVDLLVEANTARFDGGGLLVGTDIAFDGLALRKNEATVGGGMYTGGAELTLTNAVISDNQGSHGGGLAIRYGTASLSHALVAGNTAEQGGGIYLLCHGSLQASQVIVADNRASEGGGLYAHGYDPSGSASLDIVFDHAVFIGNEGGPQGGALALFRETIAPLSLAIRDSIVANNRSPEGGAIWADGDPTLTVTRSDLVDNGVVPYEGLDDPSASDGNLSVDPAFLAVISLAWEDWDLHLAVGSPLIDVGDPSSTDPDGSPSDIGAYGGPDAGSWDLDDDGWPLWWQPGPYDGHSYPAAGWDCDDGDETVFPGAGC